MQLRPYQQKWIDNTVARYHAGVNRLLGKAATGTGKTPYFANIRTALNTDKRMLVLAHRDELIQQAAKKVHQWNPNDSIGIEMGSAYSGSEDWIIASVQTLGRSGSKRITRFNPDEFAAVIVDEAHHSTADTYRNIVDHFRVFDNSELLLVGVTATPNRADGEGLGEIYDEIAFDYSILDGIRDGYLADLRGHRVPTRLSLDEVHTRVGDFELGELSRTVDTDARNELAIKSWLEYGEDRQTIGFGVDIRHCQRLAETAKNYGISAEAIWGDDPARASKLSLHRKGHIRILFNCQLLTEGYDDWTVGCILMCRPTQSEGLYTQIVGRGTRIPDGVDNIKEALRRGEAVAKKDCILIDLVDATKKHSLVTLATLHGLAPDVDLKGKPLEQVVAQIEELKKAKPLVDIGSVAAEDIDKLVQRVEEVDLFEVRYAPEVVQLSEYQWHKVGQSNYVIKLEGDDSVLLHKNLLDKWQIIGRVCENAIDEVRHTFEQAVQAADSIIRVMGGRAINHVAKREPSWSKKADPPSEAQLLLCKRFGVVVPPGATKLQVHQKLGQVLAQMKGRKKAS